MTDLTQTTKRTLDISVKAESAEESVRRNHCGTGHGILAYEDRSEDMERWTEREFDISIKADYVTELMRCECGEIHELRNGYDFGDGKIVYAS